MKKLLLTIIFLVTILVCKGQNYIPYYNQINEAEYQIYRENYQEAIGLLDNAFRIEKPHAKDLYLKAFCLDKINSEANKNEIISLLKKASINKGDVIYWIKKQPLTIELSDVFLGKLKKEDER